jgi:hypothetical protein
MTHPTPSNVHADLVPQVVALLSTRTLNQFAEEARPDEESLQQSIDRYDIDFAWHVLGSQRTLDAALSAIELRLQCPLTSLQHGEAVSLLKATSLSVEPCLLMSFDNDFAQQLAELLCDSWSAGRAETLNAVAV